MQPVPEVGVALRNDLAPQRFLSVLSPNYSLHWEEGRGERDGVYGPGNQFLSILWRTSSHVLWWFLDTKILRKMFQDKVVVIVFFSTPDYGIRPAPYLKFCLIASTLRILFHNGSDRSVKSAYSSKFVLYLMWRKHMVTSSHASVAKIKT